MKVSSPCNGECLFQDKVCVSCGRTIEHIRSWIKYTEEERLKIMSTLKPSNPNPT